MEYEFSAKDKVDMDKGGKRSRFELRNTNASRRRIRTMRFYLITLMAINLALLIIFQNFHTSEAKKIKLKDLKKVKKYAYLLATRRKRFYAIPFPVPLPVFVKRQQIYTQVPIVPHYVNKPYYVDAHDPYASMSEQYSYSELPAPTPSPSPSKYHPPAASSGYYHEFEEQQQPQSQFKQKSQVQLGGKPGKYLSHIANVINQAYPATSGGSGGSGGGSSSSIKGSAGPFGGQGEIVGKLMSGQARVLLPGTLLATLRQSRKVLAPQETESENSNSTTTSSSGSGSSKVEPANRPSASELYMNSLRAPSHLMEPQHPYGVRAVPAYHHRMPLPYAPYGRLRSPGASLGPLTRPVALHPMIHPHYGGLAAAAAGEMLQSVEPASILDATGEPAMGLGSAAGSVLVDSIGADSQLSTAAAATTGRDYENLVALNRQRVAATEHLLLQQAHRRHRQQQAAALRSAALAAAAAADLRAASDNEADRISGQSASALAALGAHQHQDQFAAGLPLLAHLPEQLSLLSY